MWAKNMVIMLGGLPVVDSKNGITHATTWSRDAFNGRMYDPFVGGEMDHNKTTYDRTITAQEAKAVYDGNTSSDGTNGNESE